MDAMKWAFFAIETLFGLIVVFLMFDRKNVGARVTRLEDEKVSCAMCHEKERLVDNKLLHIDSRFSQLNSQIDKESSCNKKAHDELKKSTADIVKAFGTFNTDTQISLVTMSGCIDKLVKEIREIKRVKVEEP